MKPAVSQGEAASIIAQHFGEPATWVRQVNGGNVARTFSCEVEHQQYIVRFNPQLGASFAKEAYIASTLASSGIPIPPILHIGQFGDLQYAISVMAPGEPLSALAPDEADAMFPATIQMLNAIHAVDVSATTGYGTFGDDGVGQFPSWRRCLEAIREEEPEGHFYGAWHRLFETSFLERHVFELVYERMTSILDYCPDNRFLVHGDFGFSNVLALDGTITAVLDWLNAKYGDFAFDIAWLDFWSSEANYAAHFHSHYADQGMDMANYWERLRCYQDYIGLDGLRFFAKADDERAYQWMRDRLLAN